MSFIYVGFEARQVVKHGLGREVDLFVWGKKPFWKTGLELTQIDTVRVPFELFKIQASRVKWIET